MNNISKETNNLIKSLEADVNGLQKALNEKTGHWEEAVNRARELEADNNGLIKALNEKAGHWEEAVNRARELEAELTNLHKGNRDLMGELDFLKYKNKELSDLHDDVVLNNWQNKKRKGIMCLNPFTRIDVTLNGDVYTCCGDYIKNGFSIGNIYQNNDFNEIWNSENAKKLRYSVTKGNFEYCTKRCQFLFGNHFYDDGFYFNPIRPIELGKYNFDNYQNCYMTDSPVNIALSCDETCNLHCNSCRSHLKVNTKEENEKMLNMLNAIIRPALKNCEELTFLGNGEFFSSNPVQEFCKTLSKKDFPILKININTNAQLLTIEKWKEFENMKEMVGAINVSVDSSEKKTYELVRASAKWERLQDALAIISNMKQNNEIEHFRLRFIVQKMNYKQILDFVSMAKKFKADIVQFQRIANLGTFNEKEFFDIDVMNPQNINYEEAKSYIENALKEQEIVVEQNVLYNGND
jgi:MoaA/NifB/PqqE/SkfB family radical SAM enzyme